jgi:hypothetical protein
LPVVGGGSLPGRRPLGPIDRVDRVDRASYSRRVTVGHRGKDAGVGSLVTQLGHLLPEGRNLGPDVVQLAHAPQNGTRPTGDARPLVTDTQPPVITIARRASRHWVRLRTCRLSRPSAARIARHRPRCSTHGRTPRSRDLTGRYSKRANWTSRLPSPRNIAKRARTAAQRARWQPPGQRTDTETWALAADYTAGATVYELADKYGIHRNTVSEHLHRQGIPMRRRGLDPDQARLAGHRYQQGQSLARIGDQLNVDPGTVRRRSARKAPAPATARHALDHPHKLTDTSAQVRADS